MTLSIPLMNDRSTEKTRADYLSELRRAGADRVFVALSRPDGSAEETALLRENIEFYQRAGLEVGVWINGFGHGGPLGHEKASAFGGYQHIIDLQSGGFAEDSFCPLDEGFTDWFAESVRRIASLRPSLIMIDDDLRLAMHGPVRFACACPLHLADISRRLGREVTREELAARIFTGKPDEYRAAWLASMHDSMCAFAAKMRAAVDEIAPEVRLGHCACLPTWDVDGVDSIELARIFAGGTKPFLRLIGAAYWEKGRSFGMMNLGNIIELERMQLTWCRRTAPEIEVFTEGDVYPRPRWNIPSACLETFDQALLADGRPDGILKYMLDYVHGPLYETGYIDRHVYNAPKRDAIAAHFSGKGAGLYCFEPMHTLADMDCTGVEPDAILSKIGRPSAKLCTAASVPVSWERDGASAAVVFGEAANYADDYFTTVPLIVDAVSARLLAGKGIDAGLVSAGPLTGVTGEYFPAEEEAIGFTGRGFYRVTLKEGAEVLSFFEAGGERVPAVWRYENAAGQRVMGYACDMLRSAARTPFLISYSRQTQLADTVTWLQGRPLPAFLAKQTDLYLLCRRDGGRLTVGIWNNSPDPALPGRISLDGRYRTLTAFGGASGALEADGIRLEAEIPAWSFAGFSVEQE